MNTENKMKQIVIIAGVVIIFLLAAPYLYKVLLKQKKTVSALCHMKKFAGN